jgi:MFS family permease
MTIVGRLGDIFGRRWFFICGAFFAMVGSLISGLAINVNMLIVGAMIKALAAATQLSYLYTIVSQVVTFRFEPLAKTYQGRTCAIEVSLLHRRGYELLADPGKWAWAYCLTVSC